jgi:hypothetical protein
LEFSGVIASAVPVTFASAGLAAVFAVAALEVCARGLFAAGSSHAAKKNDKENTKKTNDLIQSLLKKIVFRSVRQAFQPVDST